MARGKNKELGSDTIPNSGDNPAIENNDGTIAGIPIADPTTATGNAAPESADAGNAANGTAKRGRGRPPGSGKNKSPAAKKASPVSINGIESILYSAHLALAKFTKVEELELDKEESKQLADAFANVASHYDVGPINPKTAAWIGLFGVAGSIYGTRIAAFKMRKSLEKSSHDNSDSLNGNANINGQSMPMSFPMQ